MLAGESIGGTARRVYAADAATKNDTTMTLDRLVDCANIPVEFSTQFGGNMRYVDGFVIPLPKKNIAKYRSISRKAGKIWRKYGALEYRECVGDDLDSKGMGMPFPRLAKVKPGETVVFSWVVFKSRAHRDRVNAQIMKDPTIAKMMTDPKAMPFDVKRMTYGGFKVIVDV